MGSRRPPDHLHLGGQRRGQPRRGRPIRTAVTVSASGCRARAGTLGTKLGSGFGVEGSWGLASSQAQPSRSGQTKALLAVNCQVTAPGTPRSCVGRVLRPQHLDSVSAARPDSRSPSPHGKAQLEPRALQPLLLEKPVALAGPGPLRTGVLPLTPRRPCSRGLKPSASGTSPEELAVSIAVLACGSTRSAHPVPLRVG